MLKSRERERDRENIDKTYIKFTVERDEISKWILKYFERSNFNKIFNKEIGLMSGF